MPYIDTDRRTNFDPGIEHLAQEIESGGDLQYVIAELADRLLQTLAYGSNRESLRYSHCEQVMGALNGANQEFYRIVVAPYEDTCIARNGGCYRFARNAIEQAQTDAGMTSTGETPYEAAWRRGRPTLQSVE